MKEAGIACDIDFQEAGNSKRGKPAGKQAIFFIQEKQYFIRGKGLFIQGLWIAMKIIRNFK